MSDLTIPKNLVEQLCKGNCVLFVGAGISIGEGGLPSGGQLAKELAERCDYPGDDFSLDRVAQYYENNIDRADLLEYVCERIREARREPMETHKLIASLPFKTIVSTNYDCLIERALEESGKSLKVIVTDEDISSWKEDAVNLLKIHGCISQREYIVITKDDYWEFFERRPTIANILGSEAAKHSLLFVGHGLEDADFNRIYLQVTRNLAKFRRKSYAVQLYPNPVDVDFWKTKRLEIIPSDATAFLSALKQAVTAAMPAEQHLERLQEEALDDIGRALETSQEAVILPRLSIPLPPKVQQQILIAQYQAAIAANPSDLKAWLGQAEVYYELNEMDKASVAINRAWELNRQDPKVVWVRACILAEYAIAKGGPKSMLHEAIDLFESFRDKVSTASVDYSIGNCLAGLEDHHKAVEHFDRALAASPSPELAAQIWKNRGTSFFHLGNHEEEIASYKKALELNPSLWEAYSSWAATELHRGHFEHARTLFMKAFEANPELEVGGYPQLYSLAYTLWQLGDLVEAYRRVNEVLALKPDHQDGLLLKTHLLSQLWRMDSVYVSDALAFFKSRVLDNREDMFARSELYLIYNSQGYQEDARSILEETISLGNAPPRALYHYARLLEKEGKIHEAIHYLEMAFEESQEHHIVHVLGRLKQKVGDYRGAIDFYKLALRDVMDPVPILHSIADCYHFLGEYKECVRLSVRMILLEPRDEMWWTNLQYALAQLGEGGLFSVFTHFLYKLHAGNDVADEELEAAMDELLSRLRVQFGDEFVLTITSPDPT